MAGADVRILTRRDLSWAVRLTDLEGWGYTVADLERLRALEPERLNAYLHVVPFYERLGFRGETRTSATTGRSPPRGPRRASGPRRGRTCPRSRTSTPSTSGRGGRRSSP